jgi:glycosyltransferase involved in cell wall biosynthesis
VSIVIPTLERPELLTNRSLPSVLSQSYERIEVLVIGDNAAPETERAVASLGDPRVSYFNLPYKLPSRSNPDKQWAVGSVQARNEGMRRARGLWVGTFDDDDEMHPEHTSRLLACAREQRAEVAYGRYRMFTPEGTEEFGEFPPRTYRFSWTTAICHRDLRFFERELFAADFGLPNDGVVLETMLRAGVRFAMIPDVLVDYYPSRLR